MKKLYLLSTLILFAMAAMLPQRMNAQTVPVWDGAYAPWTQGSGTQADPYLIEIPWHLAYLARQVNDSAYTYTGVWFRLTSDLDMNNLAWTPIGNSTTNCFKGIFDGDGHFIDNVHILSYTNANGTEVNSTYAGLFGVINQASIMNLSLNSYIDGLYPIYVGGIVAYSCGNSNSIVNCNHSGNITFNDIAINREGFRGGIIGYINGETMLSNCQNNGQIYDNHNGVLANSHIGTICHLGGIVGGINTTATLSNCSNSGTIYGRWGRVEAFNHESYSGGLVGCIKNGNTTVLESYNNGEITGQYSGGLVGSSVYFISSSNTSYGTISISNCYNTGNFPGGIYQGGLVGYSKNCSVTNGYNAGTLTDGYSQGGLIGASQGTTSLSHCTNAGSLNTSTHDIINYTHDRYSGGIIGTCFAANFSCCANKGNVIINTFGSLGNHAICGGIIGSAYNTITLDRCYNTAAVSGLGTNTENNRYVGGLIGYLSASANEIHECYNTGSVSTGTVSSNSCGGIVGNTQGGTSITNCYNTGTLTGPNNQKSAIAYGTATLSNCYYLNTCGGSSQTGAVVQTSALMKDPIFPGMLNNGVQAFVQDVSPYVNQGYPIFGDLVYAVSTQAATNVGVTKATLHGTYAGGADVAAFQYRENTTGSEWITVNANIGSPVSYWLTGLQSNTSYVFRFMLQKNGEVYYGEEMTFITGTCNLTANISPSSVEMCQGVATPLTASGQSSLGNYFIYSWNTGSTAATLNIYNGGTFTVNVSDTNGCSATASVNVIAHPLPTVSISGNTYLCLGASSQLTASGGNTYAWSTGTNTPSITVNHGGTYSVTATNTYGCSNSDSVTVISLENLSISGNTHICSGQSTILSVNGAGSYTWNTGASAPSITVSDPGTYTVTATLPNGCSSSTSVLVTTASQPTPTIVGSTSICQGQTATLTATGGSTYLWSNGNTTNHINVSQSGSYAVTATNADGCSASTNVTVTVNPLPTVSISGVNSICQGQTTTLTANGGSTYAWSSGSSTPSITVSQGGVYTVTATNTAGCSATEEITVTVKPLPNVSISGNSSFCQGDYTLLTATGANTYLWNNNSTLETITVNNAGNYTVMGTGANGCSNTATMTAVENPIYNLSLSHSICQGEVYNFNGQNLTTSGIYTQTLPTVNGCDSTITLTLTVKALPTPSISGNTVICEGQSTTLTATGGNTYLWSDGSTNASVTLSQSGVYTVTATNTDGCSATTSVTVSTSPLPTISISGNTTICEGGSTTLIATGADTYNWSTGDNTATATISVFGIYTVTGVSALGCSNTASVTVLALPAPQITISGETDICAGESTTLTANGGETYLWSNGTTDATLTVSNAGSYQVIGYNEAGCNAMASATVNVWQPVTSEFTIECPDSCYIWNGESYCQSGDYTQTLQSVHGCDSVVTLHLTITVGVDVYDGLDFKVFPNPTSDVINVQITNHHSPITEIHLVDAYGRLLDVVGVNNRSPLQTTQIDLSRYADGVYFVKAVADGKTVAVRKVVKG